MIKFTEKEYEYILNKMKEDRKYFDTCTKKELLEWLDKINGANYDTVILFTDFKHKLKDVNKIKVWNNRVIQYMVDTRGM
ncbi:hypothetical protein G8T75_12840 [Clostridium botulinum D/C]|uniref:hypothetical protein n=1 Tax=Clostridium botulinum TaxID=1491 RepID=UPI001E60BB6B|nr:hypothetical protein [Clostridium botulinum]MCD3240844.1 hypothetical protein [Clostridium botulinum D/C]